MAMSKQLAALYAGEIGWREFETRTRTDFRVMALYLRRGRALPPSVDTEDVRQELMIAACRQIESWRPDGGQPLDKWVVQGAMLRTRAWMRAQRYLPADELRHDCSTMRLSEADRVLEAKEHYARLLETANAREHYFARAFVQAGGSSRKALEILRADVRARVACRLDCDDCREMDRIRTTLKQAVGL